MHAKRKRVLIVGAKFGELYLNSFMQDVHPLEPHRFELAGVLATGSPRSRQLAHAFGVPLYTSIEQLPGDLDIACVVVRSAVVGGRGSSLAEALLTRSMHVIQEHPLHPDDVARLQNLAATRKLTYWVNAFYTHTPTGQCWIERAQRIRKLLGGEPAHYAQVTTSRQLLYSSLDLLLQASGISADSIDVTLIDGDDPTFHVLRLRSPGCSIILRLQAYLDPADPDLHSLAMHQLSLGWPAGYLSLHASFGPVIWTPALDLPNPLANELSLYRSVRRPEGASLAQPSALVLHSAPPSWQNAFELDGPAGVGWLLSQLVAQLEGHAAPPSLEPSAQLALARLWQRVLRCAGPATERSLSRPVLIDPKQLLGGAPKSAALASSHSTSSSLEGAVL